MMNWNTPENYKAMEMNLKKSDEERKEIERISKHIHPHDDEPDPTAQMGNYNFPQMLFAFWLGLHYVCLSSR